MIAQFLGEIIGTFVFLAVIMTSGHSSSKILDSFAWIKIGLALSVSILLVGFVSGAHLNPAVSFMLYLNDDIKMDSLVVYIVAQLIGATLAYFYYSFLKNSRIKGIA